MSFTVRDYKDLIQLLAEHPEWREELRRALLSDDFLALPQIVRELAEAQKRTEQRLEELAEAQKRTEQRLDELAEAQKRTEERLEALAKRVDELAEAQKRTAQRLDELVEAQKRTEERLEALAKRFEELTEVQKLLAEDLAALTRRVDDIGFRLTQVERRLAKLDGRTLEIEYERKAGSYFRQILSRTRVVNLVELEDMIPSAELQEKYQDLWNLDILIQGRLRWGDKGEEKPEAWLAVEVSVLIDREDVERAKRRADLLRQAGYLALPVVAGEDLTERALQLAEQEGVIMVTDGRTRLLDQAIQKALTNSTHSS